MWAFCYFSLDTQNYNKRRRKKLNGKHWFAFKKLFQKQIIFFFNRMFCFFSLHLHACFVCTLQLLANPRSFVIIIIRHEESYDKCLLSRVTRERKISEGQLKKMNRREKEAKIIKRREKKQHINELFYNASGRWLTPLYISYLLIV